MYLILKELGQTGKTPISALHSFVCQCIQGRVTWGTQLQKLAVTEWFTKKRYQKNHFTARFSPHRTSPLLHRQGTKTWLTHLPWPIPTHSHLFPAVSNQKQESLTGLDFVVLILNPILPDFLSISLYYIFRFLIRNM